MLRPTLSQNASIPRRSESREVVTRPPEADTIRPEGAYRAMRLPGTSGRVKSYAEITSFLMARSASLRCPSVTLAGLRATSAQALARTSPAAAMPSSTVVPRIPPGVGGLAIRRNRVHTDSTEARETVQGLTGSNMIWLYLPGGEMRKEVQAAAFIAAVAVSACGGGGASKGQGMSDDLARDVALLDNSTGLALAPSSGSRTVISAEERAPIARPTRAASARSSRPVARHSEHREAVKPHSSTSRVAAAAPSPEPSPAPSAADAAPGQTEVADATTAAAAPDAPAADAPVADPAPESRRPHPVDIGAAQGGAAGAGRRGGFGIGDVIGVIGGVVLRGGVVDGDRCDPRGRDRERRGGFPIAINDRGGPLIRGTF